MESTSRSDKINNPVKPFKILPDHVMDGKPYFVLVISDNNNKQKTHYLYSPVKVAHMMQAAHRKRHLAFVYMSVMRNREDGTSLKEFADLKTKLQSMGTINWLGHEEKWRRWNKWKRRSK